MTSQGCSDRLSAFEAQKGCDLDKAGKAGVVMCRARQLQGSGMPAGPAMKQAWAELKKKCQPTPSPVR